MNTLRLLLVLAIPVCGVLSAQTPKQGPAAAGAGGFKVGDTVQVNTGFGWVEGQVLQMRGSSYYVHVQNGVDVWKDYPAEIRRIGTPNAEDRTRGVFELHDRVQVNFEGKWVDSEVIAILGTDYQVTLPGNRLVWATPQQLRFVGPQVKPEAAKAGTPPKPGLANCAGKFDGRYSTGGLGNFNIVFKGAKAAVSMYGDAEDVECWTGGGKIYLHKPGEKDDMVLDINNDGTLDSPAGELKKKS